MASHIPPGTAFCCAAEAMLLGLAPPSMFVGPNLYGPVTAENVEVFAKLASELGFLAAAGGGADILEVGA